MIVLPPVTVMDLVVDPMPPTPRRLAGEEHGAAMLEYGLLISLLALACFGVVKIFGACLLPLFVVETFHG